MSSGHTAAFTLDAEALRAHLESLDIDPDAFAGLPDDMQDEILQTVPHLEQSALPVSARVAGGESSLGLREQVQDGQGIRCEREERSHGSRDGSVNSAENGSDYESDLEQYEAAPQRGPSHPYQSHAEPAMRTILTPNPNPNLDPDLLQLLQSHGIDADAFAGMPDDIQSEILMMLPDAEDSASQLSSGSEGGAGGGAAYTRQQPAPVGFGAAVMTPSSSSERAIIPHPSPAAAPFASDSRVIFSMGFDPALVSRALRCNNSFPTSPAQLLPNLSFTTPSQPLLHNSFPTSPAQF
jgi:hypothetical protein